MTQPQLKVLDRYGCYETVLPEHLQHLLSDEAKQPDVHHINAIGELGDRRFFPILLRALRSSDHRVLRALSRVAVRRKLFDLATPLQAVAEHVEDSLSKSMLLAASIYLREADRGLSFVITKHPMSVYLVTNLLAVRDFDMPDYRFAKGAFICLVNVAKTTLRGEEKSIWVESMMPDAINGLAGAIMNDTILLSLSVPEVDSLLHGIDTLRQGRYFRQLEREAQSELSLIQQRLQDHTRHTHR